MRSARKVLVCSLVLTALAAAMAPPARSQFLEPAIRSLDLGTGSPVRSARLLGMGRLALIGDDRDDALSLWDFAGSPAGVYDDDSVSTMTFRPGTDAADGAHDRFDGVRRQDLAARNVRLQFEGFRRDRRSGGVFGVVADLNSLRFDRPYSDDVSRRDEIGLPAIMPILSGKLPYVGNGAIRYAVRGRFAGENTREKYQLIQENGEGQFISLDGDAVNPPDLFAPDEFRVNTSGVGAAFSFPVAKGHSAALGIDAVSQRIKGSNVGDRHSTERRESRPYLIGQGSLVGRVGALEYAADGRGWTANSTEDWRFTVSGGVGSLPLTGRGKLQEREERGSSFDSRVRWKSGAFEFGGQFLTRAIEAKLTPPGLEDGTSFNAFIRALRGASGSDTLAVPDSVIANEINDRAFGFGGGVGWASGRTRLGTEFHWRRDLRFQAVNGSGPERQAWEARAGAEYRCNEVLTGRLGYVVNAVDEDTNTEQNEYTGHGPTLGLGLAPKGSNWDVQAGWALQLRQSDFGDPSQQRQSRQNLSVSLHWGF